MLPPGHFAGLLQSLWASPVAQRLRIHLQHRSHRRCIFDHWVRKIPWRRAWQPWTEEPGVLQSTGVTKSGTQLKQLSTHAHTHTRGLSAWTGPRKGCRGACACEAVELGLAFFYSLYCMGEVAQDKLQPLVGCCRW